MTQNLAQDRRLINENASNGRHFLKLRTNPAVLFPAPFLFRACCRRSAVGAISAATEQFHFGSTLGPERGQLEAIAHLEGEGDSSHLSSSSSYTLSSSFSVFLSSERTPRDSANKEGLILVRLFAPRILRVLVASCG